MTIVFVFKNGYELKAKCEKFSLITHKSTGETTGYVMSGIEDNKILCVDFNEIQCIYQR